MFSKKKERQENAFSNRLNYGTFGLAGTATDCAVQRVILRRAARAFNPLIAIALASPAGAEQIAVDGAAQTIKGDRFGIFHRLPRRRVVAVRFLPFAFDRQLLRGQAVIAGTSASDKSEVNSSAP